MSNGFFFLPETLLNQLKKQSNGDPAPLLKKILLDFIAQGDHEQVLSPYLNDPDDDDVDGGDNADNLDHEAGDDKESVIDSDAFGLSYPEIWEPLGRISRRFNTTDEKLIAAVVYHHFNPPSPSAVRPSTAPALQEKLYTHARATAPRLTF